MKNYKEKMSVFGKDMVDGASINDIKENKVHIPFYTFISSLFYTSGSEIILAKQVFVMLLSVH